MYWHWQNLTAQKHPGAFPRHGRAWLRLLGNSIGTEWDLFSKRCAINIIFSSVDDNDITFSIGIPFLASLWLSVEQAKWIKRLPGVKWNGRSDSGEREIGAYVSEWGIWWDIWTTPGEWKNWWREGSFQIDDFFLGRKEYSESTREVHDTQLLMPEGTYPAKVELFTSTWKRSRWPFATSIKRAKVEIEGGVPIPGNLDSDFYSGDDAVYGSAHPASTVEEAMKNVRASVVRDRLRYSSPEWTPQAGCRFIA